MMICFFTTECSIQHENHLIRRSGYYARGLNLSGDFRALHLPGVAGGAGGAGGVAGPPPVFTITRAT